LEIPWWARPVIDEIFLDFIAHKIKVSVISPWKSREPLLSSVFKRNPLISLLLVEKPLVFQANNRNFPGFWPFWPKNEGNTRKL